MCTSMIIYMKILSISFSIPYFRCYKLILQTIENKKFRLATINMQMRDFSEDLKTLPPSILDCLETFIDCIDLVKWCRETMPSKFIL